MSNSEKITWTECKVRLGDLQEWPDNPALISIKQAERLMESYIEFGQAHVFLIDPENMLIDGHQRKKVWVRKLGADFMVDCRKSSRMLTEPERRKIALFLRSGAVGQYDWNALSSWDFEELEIGGFDDDMLKALNNDANNLKEMLAAAYPDESADAEPAIDRAAELLEKWGVETGDLWQIGDHRLICGDCTDPAVVARVMGGERADMVFTDPPYGIEYDNAKRWEGLKKQSEGAAKHLGPMIEGDDKEFDPSFILSGFSYCKEIFLWGMQYYLGALPNGGVIVWNRKSVEQKDLPFADFELCWSKQQRHKMAWITWGGWKSKEKGEERLHTTQKPVELAEWFIAQWSKEGNIVFDGYAGSGFTLVACENTGRMCRAADIDAKYVAVTLERMATAFPALEIARIL